MKVIGLASDILPRVATMQTSHTRWRLLWKQANVIQA